MTTVTLPSSPVADRVRLGIAWLDEHSPAWRTALDLDTLDMSDPSDCVLGQVFWAESRAEDYPSGFSYVLESGYYRDAAGSLFTVDWMVAHGFEAYQETAQTIPDYCALGYAWEAAMAATEV